MKVLVDEQTPVFYTRVIRDLLPQDSVKHVDELRWKSKKDHRLLPDAKRRGFNVFITNDRSQLNDPHETRVIVQSGLHHVCYPRIGSGLRGQGLTLASLAAALSFAMEEIRSATNQLFIAVKKIDGAPSSRVIVRDLVINRPPYRR